MHRGKDRLKNNSLVKLSDIEWDIMDCVMEMNGRTIDNPEGRWYYPNGDPVNCASKTDPFKCKLTADKKGVRLYRNPKITGRDGLLALFNPGTYTCCLPDRCDLDATIRTTVRIWSELKEWILQNLVNPYLYILPT